MDKGDGSMTHIMKCKIKNWNYTCGEYELCRVCPYENKNKKKERKKK